MVDLSLNSLKALSTKKGKLYGISCYLCKNSYIYNADSTDVDYVVIRTIRNVYPVCKSCLIRYYREFDGNILKLESYLDSTREL